MKVYSARLSLKGTSTIYMGSIPPVPTWSRDSPYVRFVLQSQAIRAKRIYSIKEKITTNLQVGFQSS
jgi:hypothetical protein